MMDERIKATLDNVVENIILPFFKDTDLDLYIGSICDLVKSKCPDWKVYCGCTKITLLHETCPYVIKLTREYHQHSKDHVMLEYKMYNKAKKQGLEEMFPHTVLKGHYHFRNSAFTCVYQQKVTCCLDDIASNPSKQMSDLNILVHCKQASNFYVPKMNRTTMRLDFVKYMGYYHGKDKIRKLINFIWVNDIGDLHTGNVGFIKKKPVLLDFSGYFG